MLEWWITLGYAALPMLSAHTSWGLGLVMLAACGLGQGEHLRTIHAPQPPAAVPETWDFKDPSTLAENREAAMAACAWYLDVAPATADSAQWVRTRNFALDWIEAMTAPKIPVTQQIVAHVVTDTRFMYSAYMRAAYQCGKAEHLLLRAPDAVAPPLDLPAEIAGIDAMQRLFRALSRWDPKTYSRRLRQLARKQKKNQLEAFLLKLTNKSEPRQRRR